MHNPANDIVKPKIHLAIPFFGTKVIELGLSEETEKKLNIFSQSDAYHALEHYVSDKADLERRRNLLSQDQVMDLSSITSLVNVNIYGRWFKKLLLTNCHNLTELTIDASELEILDIANCSSLSLSKVSFRNVFSLQILDAREINESSELAVCSLNYKLHQLKVYERPPLKVLKLKNSTKIGSADLASFFGWLSLEEIWLHNYQFEDGCFKNLYLSSNLKTFSLEGAVISYSNLQDIFANGTQLTQLSLKKCINPKKTPAKNIIKGTVSFLIAEWAVGGSDKPLNIERNLSLQCLDLSESKVLASTDFLKVLKKSPNLNQLNLSSRNDLVNSNFDEVILEKLDSLNLSGCSALTSSKLKALISSTQLLSSLHLNGCSQISLDAFENVNLQNMINLSLNYCNFPDDRELANFFSRMHNLKQLCLRGWKNYFNGVFAISNFTGLEKIDFRDCIFFTDKALGELIQATANEKGVSTLTTISLRNNRCITGSGFIQRSGRAYQFPQLQVLDIRDCVRLEGGHYNAILRYAPPELGLVDSTGCLFIPSQLRTRTISPMFTLHGISRVHDCFLRWEYNAKALEIQEEAKRMLAEGLCDEYDAAAWAINERNLLKDKIRKEGDPIDSYLYSKRNEKLYGNPLGPSPEDLMGSKEDWQKIQKLLKEIKELKQNNKYAGNPFKMVKRKVELVKLLQKLKDKNKNNQISDPKDIIKNSITNTNNSVNNSANLRAALGAALLTYEAVTFIIDLKICGENDESKIAFAYGKVARALGAYWGGKMITELGLKIGEALGAPVTMAYIIQSWGSKKGAENYAAASESLKRGAWNSYISAAMYFSPPSDNGNDSNRPQSSAATTTSDTIAENQERNQETPSDMTIDFKLPHFTSPLHYGYIR